jgi:single-strand DNA-binding protein
MNLNRVQIAGNLTRDPELRYTPKGTAVCRIGVAVNRKWKGEDGELKEEVTFVDCDAWNKTAEAIGQYLKKGRGIYVEGRLKLDQWEDKQTQEKRSKMKVVVESFQFTDRKPDGEEEPRRADTRSSTPGQHSRPAAHDTASGAEPDSDGPPEDDNVPF